MTADAVHNFVSLDKISVLRPLQKKGKFKSGPKRSRFSPCKNLAHFEEGNTEFS
jgi:hypothetical protein